QVSDLPDELLTIIFRVSDPIASGRRPAKSSVRPHGKPETCRASGGEATIGSHMAAISVEKTIHVLLRIEDHQIVQLLAAARVANRKPKFFRDRDGDSAFRRSIKLRQNDSRYARNLQKLSRLFQPVLAGHRIDNQQRLVRR